jgi:hypothetical protein
MTPLLILWAGLTLVLVVLLIYRSTLTMHEDDQLFLDNAEAHMGKEQEELISRMDSIQPWLRICGTLSVVLGFVIVAVEIFSVIKR